MAKMNRYHVRLKADHPLYRSKKGTLIKVRATGRKDAIAVAIGEVNPAITWNFRSMKKKGKAK